MAAPRDFVMLWRSFLKCNLQNRNIVHRVNSQCSRCLSTTIAHRGPDDPSSSVGNAGAKKAEKISMAMRAYLQRAQAHEEYMKNEISEYEIGKRHLANIMGADPDNFTQDDIDGAIRYLLPSGIFDKKSRPLLKHPIEVIPKKKDAQFGADGRPFHSMFYTGFPNFFKLARDFAEMYENLKIIEDEMNRKAMTPLQTVNLRGSQWINKKALETKLGEIISERMYTQFVHLVERVATNPWAHRHKDLIFEYRKILPSMDKLQDIAEAKISESGRLYQEGEGSRKSAKAKVTIWDHGSGDVSINGKNLLDYFPYLLDREQIMFPLQFCKKLGQVDFEAHIESGGSSGQAGALRLALAQALTSFVDKDMVEKMRLAGLLTRDPRIRERKKYGQEGARRKYTWKKR